MRDELRAALDAVVAGSTGDEHESTTLEFKRQGRSRPDTEVTVAEAIACLANASGGAVVVGVADAVPGEAGIEGCDLDAEMLKRRVYELTDPSLVPSVTAVEYMNRRLLVIEVPASADVHQVHGRAAERIGKSCQPMSSRRIAQVVSERRGDDWSSGETSRAPVEISARAVEDVRALLERSSDPTRRGHARLVEGDLLRVLGLLSPSGTLNAAGELLLAGRNRPSGEIAYVFRRGTSGELVVNERLEGPLVSCVVRTLELVDARVDRTPVNLPAGQQQQLADLPDTAVREAVVNAVMHRDYRVPGEVHVEHVPTRLAVTSPGPFVTGVTADNVLTTAPRARNPVLAGAVRTMGLAEAAGVGVDRMYAAMARIGHQPPVYDADLERVRVRLLGGAPNTHVARFAATLPPEHAEAPDTMLVLLTLLTSRTVTAAGIAPILQRPDAEAGGVLEQLAAEPISLIERTRETARHLRGTYRLREHAIAALGPAVAYRRRTQDESDRKIIGLVRETAEINSRMVRLLLDVDGLTASRLLADLVERGILVKTSRAQRGPGVTYGPGPSIPRKRRSRSSGLE